MTRRAPIVAQSSSEIEWHERLLEQRHRIDAISAHLHAERAAGRDEGGALIALARERAPFVEHGERVARYSVSIAAGNERAGAQ